MRGGGCGAIFRAIAEKRYFASWDRESRAGERLRLAGYSSGRGDCARGGRSAWRCGSLAGTEPGARFSRGVLRSITPAVCRLSAKQDGLRYVAFLFRRGSGSPAARSRIVGAVIEGGWFTSGLRVFWRRSRRSTRGCGERSQRRGVSIFLRKPISLAMLSAGRTLGLKCGSRTAAAPRLRQRAIGSLDSLHLGRGVGAFCAASIVRFTSALGQRLPVHFRMCFFVTATSGRKSRDFMYSVRL